MSTFAFSARTHAILLIVSGSFVLETSSSCGLVVPMRVLPRPMGPASRSTYFRRRRRRHRLSSTFLPPGRRLREEEKERARRFRSDDTIEKMLPLLYPSLRPFPLLLRQSRTLKLCKRSYLEATLCSCFTALCLDNDWLFGKLI